MLLTIAALGLLGAAARAAQEPILVIVDSPRPLMAAVDVVEERCDCIVTYEDPQWRPDQLVEAIGAQGGRLGSPAHVPKGGRFDIAFPDESFAAPVQVRAALDEAIRQFEEQFPGMGSFSVMSDEPRFSVRPRGTTLLDVPVTPPGDAQPVVGIVWTALQQAGAATGVHVALGRTPSGLEVKTTLKGDAEPARNVINRALAATGHKMSWRLLYDGATGRYDLSIRPVE